MNKKIKFVLILTICSTMMASFKEEKPWEKEARESALHEKKKEKQLKWRSAMMKQDGLVQVTPYESEVMKLSDYFSFQYTDYVDGERIITYWASEKDRKAYRERRVEEKMKVRGYVPVSAREASVIEKNIGKKSVVSSGKYWINEHDLGEFKSSKEGKEFYYLNQLPWYKRWVQNIASFFSQKPPSSSSGALKSYASVPLPTTQTRQRSRITMPKYIAPTTQKTLERAKKLETPYIPAASAKDSASKALKRADRFGGYQ